MYPESRYVDPKVQTQGLLCGQSKYCLGTWHRHGPIRLLVLLGVLIQLWGAGGLHLLEMFINVGDCKLHRMVSQELDPHRLK